MASYQVTVGAPESATFGFDPTGGATRFSVTLGADADALAVADDLRARLTALG